MAEREHGVFALHRMLTELHGKTVHLRVHVDYEQGPAPVDRGEVEQIAAEVAMSIMDYRDRH